MRLKFTVILSLVALVLAMATASSAVLADEGDIEVTQAEAESQFPDGILFRVAAESPGIIDEARVFIKKADQSGLSTYRSIDFEPGESVAAETVLPTTTRAEYFPPGTKISFYFEVRDKAGALVRTDETDFVYEDNRFHWLTLSDGLITVYYYSEFVEERARIILEAAKETMDRMVPVLGIAPTEPLRIVTYNNYRHMVMALPFRSQTVSEDLQAQGMAFTDERVLLIHGYDPTVTGTVSHEFVHLLVAEAAGGTSAAIPAWLNEGLAEYGNVDPTDEYDAALRYGVYTRRIRPLWFQQSFSGEPEDIIIAYGQGKSVVNMMVRRWGEDKISDLFTAVRETNDIDSALLQIYGVDQYGMDSAWRESLGLEPLPSPEELQRRMESSSETGDTEVSGDPAPSNNQPETQQPGEDASADGQATQEPPGAQQADDGDSEGGSSSPCSAPPAGSATLGLGMLALMASPLSLAGIPLARQLRNRRDEVTWPWD